MRIKSYQKSCPPVCQNCDLEIPASSVNVIFVVIKVLWESVCGIFSPVKAVGADFMSTQSISISPDEIHFDFIRASGPGGQNVNKVSTAVQLRFDVRNSQSLTPEIRERLIRLAGKRINSSGELIIVAKRFRTQQRNREDAMQRLLRLIEKAGIPPKTRRKSRPSVASKLKRLEDKRRRSGLKKLRSRVSTDE